MKWRLASLVTIIATLGVLWASRTTGPQDAQRRVAIIVTIASHDITRFACSDSVVVYTWDTRFGSVWKAWHFVVIHENVSLTLQLRRILSKSSMWKCRTSYSNISKKFLGPHTRPTQLCLLAEDAATMCRVESTLISWRRQYFWQAGGPFHYSLIVELKFDGKYW